MEVLGHQPGYGGQERPDHLNQGLVGAVGSGLHVVLEQGDGPVNHLVDVGAVVGGQGDQLVEGYPGGADGQPSSDHSHRPLVEEGSAFTFDRLQDSVVTQERHQALGHTGPIGHLPSGQAGGVGGVGKAVQGVGPGRRVEVGDLGEREALFGESPDLCQAVEMGVSVHGSSSPADRRLEEAETLVVADGVNPDSAGRRQTVHGE